MLASQTSEAEIYASIPGHQLMQTSNMNDKFNHDTDQTAWLIRNAGFRFGVQNLSAFLLYIAKAAFP